MWWNYKLFSQLTKNIVKSVFFCPTLQHILKVSPWTHCSQNLSRQRSLPNKSCLYNLTKSFFFTWPNLHCHISILDKILLSRVDIDLDITTPYKTYMSFFLLITTMDPLLTFNIPHFPLDMYPFFSRSPRNIRCASGLVKT